MSKILREEVIQDIPGSGGFLDLMDGLIYSFYNITSKELDQILESATDEELEQFIDATVEGEKLEIEKIRRGIEVRNRYVEYFKSKK